MSRKCSQSTWSPPKYPPGPPMTLGNMRELSDFSASRCGKSLSAGAAYWSIESFHRRFDVQKEQDEADTEDCD
jgi:hypothetical protein